MPKRQKSHEHCRNRFGIFSKRRRVSSADHRCDQQECVNNRAAAAALAARQRRKSVEKPGEAGPHPPGHESSSSCGAVVSLPSSSSRNQQNTACDCHQVSAESSVSAPWLSRAIWNHATVSRKVTCVNYEPAEGAFPTAPLPLEVIAPAGSSGEVTMNRTSSTAVDFFAESSMDSASTRTAFGETIERSRTVSSLVALTSSLKLTEGGHPPCVSDTSLSNRMPMDTSPVQESMPKPPVPAPCSANHASASTLGSHSKTVSHKPVHVHSSGVYEPRRHAGSHRYPPRHGQRVLPPLPRVNVVVVREPHDDAEDSDEGFCEPAAKRSHRQSPGSDRTVEADEGVNVAEEALPGVLRRRRMEYTNHSLDASLGCTCSLYWQMMSNQYGVPTKIYTLERSHLICPIDGCSKSTPFANDDLDLGAPMFGRTQNTAVSTNPSSSIPFDCQESSDNGRSSILDHEQQGSIFAVGSLVQDHSNVQGAIGLCLQRAVRCNKSVFVFDAPDEDEAGNWYRYCLARSRFVPCPTVPTLTKDFAGLGANELTEAARMAIKSVFRKTFGTP